MSVFHNDPEKLKTLHEIWKQDRDLVPVPCGLKPSMGYGDRLGLATPGHLAAHREAGLEGRVVPLFAQQSAREMDRTNRSPVDVMLDAVTSLEAHGYRGSHCADADHMKSEEHVIACLEAGFTWYTADPSDLVRDDADEIPLEEVDPAFQELLTKFPKKFDHYLESYVGEHSIPGIPSPIVASEEDVKRVALKYGPALYRTADIERWVQNGWPYEDPFDFEISVDETSAPTSPLAHLIIALELKRLGIRITSLAPRFVGEFQKAIDYIGDLEEFRKDLKYHVAIARAKGPYKISVHSGSDKFSIYPILAEECGELLHLKTAGTSYLEALRVVARKAPELFREIARYSAGVFEEQRVSYHIKADLENFPDPDEIADDALERSFLASPESDDARQVLHVCFGAVLLADAGKRFGERIKTLLREEADEYERVLKNHFSRHLTTFKSVS